MASPLCVNTEYKEWVKKILYTHKNCKDARDLDILVFVLFLVLFGFYVLGFGFWLGVFRFLSFLSFWGGLLWGFDFDFLVLFCFCFLF